MDLFDHPTFFLLNLKLPVLPLSVALKVRNLILCGCKLRLCCSPLSLDLGLSCEIFNLDTNISAVKAQEQRNGKPRGRPGSHAIPSMCVVLFLEF